MDDLEFGPVELILAEFTGDRPSAPVIDALRELSDSGTIRLLDLLYIRKDESGAVTYAEVSDAGPDAAPLDLAAGGLASDDDVEELAAMLPAGASAVLLVVELLWAKKLASRLFDAGGAVIDSIRIPAPVVNLVAAEAARIEEEQEVG